MRHILLILKETRLPTRWRVGVGWKMFVLNRQLSLTRSVSVNHTVNLCLSSSSCWTYSRSGIGPPTWLTTGNRPANTWESTHTLHWPCWRSKSVISTAASAGFPLLHHTVICPRPSFPSVNSLESTVLPAEHWSTVNLIERFTGKSQLFATKTTFFEHFGWCSLSPVRPLCHVLTGYISREYRLCLRVWWWITACQQTT